MKGLIWQSDENIIDVVYQTIYGMPIKEAMSIIKQYQECLLIPRDYLLMWRTTHDEFSVARMLDDWDKDKALWGK